MRNFNVRFAGNRKKVKKTVEDMGSRKWTEDILNGCSCKKSNKFANSTPTMFGLRLTKQLKKFGQHRNKKNRTGPLSQEEPLFFGQDLFLDIGDNQEDKPSVRPARWGHRGWRGLPTPPLRQPLVQLMDICHSPTTAERAAVSAAMKYV